MAIKLAGIVSGMDTDAMVDELVKAYSTKKDDIYREQKTLSYLQDSWKSINTDIYSFYSGSLGGMRFSGSYSLKTAAISDETKAKISASSSAVNGTQTLTVENLAKSGYLTGARLTGDLKGSTKLLDLGVSGNVGFTIVADGKEGYVNFDANTTIDQFVSKLKEAGVNASFDATNKRFFMSSKTSGEDGDFAILANSSNATDALKSLGLYSVSESDIKAYQSYIDKAAADPEYINNLAKTDYLNSLLDAQTTKYTNRNNEITSHNADLEKQIKFANSSPEERQKSMEALDKSLSEAQIARDKLTVGTDEYKEADEKFKTIQETKVKFAVIRAEIEANGSTDFVNAKKAEIEAGKEELIENNKILTNVAKARGGKIADKEKYLTDNSLPYSYESDAYTAYNDYYTTKLAYSQTMTTKYADYKSAIANNDTTAIEAYKTELGLSQAADTGAIRIAGEDSIIYLNGAQYVSNTNVFNVNGLTITAMGLTEDDEPVSITTADDVQGIYDKIKSFLTSYNELIKKMDSNYNAESAGKYKPLTKDEEKDMSDNQVEKWEKKLKEAALSKDSTLKSVITAMKTAMTKSYTIDGEDLSLASFGVKTLGYFSSGENEKGMFHIDGDSKDSTTSGNKEKLMAAIASNPEQVIGFFSTLSSAVYKALGDKMSSSTLSSAYKVYNDKYMKKQYDDYDDKLKEWDKKVEDMRSKYEKQFSEMEKALSTLNQQQSNLSSMLGS